MHISWRNLIQLVIIMYNEKLPEKAFVYCILKQKGEKIRGGEKGTMN